MLTWFFLICTKLLKAVIPLKRRALTDKYKIVLTGTFYSDNWITSHLKPLAGSRKCDRLYMVATRRVPSIANVKAVYAPRWLVKVVGEVPARLMLFALVCFRVKPELIGGFHLLINGMAAGLLAAGMGVKSIYFCGGGIREVKGGGYTTESKLFSRLEKPSQSIEKNLLRFLDTIDIVIAMGSSAVRFFADKGVKSSFYIVPGGFDGKRYYPSKTSRKDDLILVGRLSEVKCVDLFLAAIKQLAERLPTISATIVGDGPLKSELEKMAVDLGIAGNVNFAGMQKSVEDFLRNGKVFVLTSSSEGLSLAMVEAMLCGLVPVVSDVGDLGDLVENGENGYLVKQREPEAFAAIIDSILKDNVLREQLSANARKSAEKLIDVNTSRQWDGILSQMHRY